MKKIVLQLTLHPSVVCLLLTLAAAEIADFLVGEGLVQAAATSAAAAATLAVAPQASALVAAASAAHAWAVITITASSHDVPGGQLGFSAAAGNDRITPVPLERWDIEVPPADAPTGGALRASCRWPARQMAAYLPFSSHMCGAGSCC